MPWAAARGKAGACALVRAAGSPSPRPCAAEARDRLNGLKPGGFRTARRRKESRATEAKRFPRRPDFPCGAARRAHAGAELSRGRAPVPGDSPGGFPPAAKFRLKAARRNSIRFVRRIRRLAVRRDGSRSPLTWRSEAPSRPAKASARARSPFPRAWPRLFPGLAGGGPRFRSPARDPPPPPGNRRPPPPSGAAVRLPPCLGGASKTRQPEKRARSRLKARFLRSRGPHRLFRRARPASGLFRRRQEACGPFQAGRPALPPCCQRGSRPSPPRTPPCQRGSRPSPPRTPPCRRGSRPSPPRTPPFQGACGAPMQSVLIFPWAKYYIPLVRLLKTREIS
jgi:hypothetical protein